MKKNNKGFFLAETIVVIALVTTVMAFVYPNITKLYDNYKNRTIYYDQTEDLFALWAVYESMKTTNSSNTILINGISTELTVIQYVTYGGNDNGCSVNEIGGKNINDLQEIEIEPIGAKGINGLQKLYITGYMSSPSDSNYNFNKYLKRIKKTNYDKSSYRLVGIFKEGSETRYASIKIDNPNPNRTCNLGG